MLPGVCPGCGLRADLDVFCVQADIKQALAAALDLPAPLGGRVLRYLRLFSPASKTLALNKTVRLLVELAAVVRSAQIERRGVAYAAPLGLWETALDTVLNQPPDTLPLTSHGYLFQVAWNLADRAATRQERAAEERLRQGQRPPAETPPAPAPLPAGAASAPSVSPADAAAFSSPSPTPPPARTRPTAEFRALLGQLTGALVNRNPPVSTPEEE